MSYYLFKYSLFFLPIAIIAYQLTPKKYRYITMLITNYIFYCLISGLLVVYLIISTVLCYGFSIEIEKCEAEKGEDKKKNKKKKQCILCFGISLFLLVLFVLKYFNFFAGGMVKCLSCININVSYTPIHFLIPIGISYYTLQIISYIVDVSNGTQKADHNIAKVALYLSFFPQIMEGPISRFSEIADDLYEGKSVTYYNLCRGYQRIAWGLFKKYLIADRVAAVVKVVFTDYSSYDGSIIMVGVLMYTLQLYMDFSGGIDIAIGSGEIFGISLPENFKQPFFAKNASEFWHRWHITLGTWFKDYIFYPVSMSKSVKKLGKAIKKKTGKYLANIVTSMIALFCVWSMNGLWHGPRGTYIFYGLYYFVVISLEIIMVQPFEWFCKKLHINREWKLCKAFRFIKLFCIVNVGELFFRAETVQKGFQMLGAIFTNFHFGAAMDQILNIGIDVCDWLIVAVSFCIVVVVGVMREKQIDIRWRIHNFSLPLRWMIWYSLLFMILLFGAYGPEYSDVAMIYAGY